MSPKAAVSAVEKRKISHPCQESKHDISIVQPVSSHFYVPSKNRNARARTRDYDAGLHLAIQQPGNFLFQAAVTKLTKGGDAPSL